MICLTLYALANFLKALATKLLSSAFYRTAHFKKVKEAIDKVRRAGLRCTAAETHGFMVQAERDHRS